MSGSSNSWRRTRDGNAWDDRPPLGRRIAHQPPPPPPPASPPVPTQPPPPPASPTRPNNILPPAVSPPPPSKPPGPSQRAPKAAPSNAKTAFPKKGPPAQPPKGAPAKGVQSVTAYTSVPIKTGSSPPPPPKASGASSVGSSPSPPPPPPKASYKPPPPPPPPVPDVPVMTAEKAILLKDVPWDNRNVSEENNARLVRYDPNCFREPNALEVERRQEALWTVGRGHESPAKSTKTVEEYLKKLRTQNQKEKDEIVKTALQLKEHFWFSDKKRNFDILQEHVRGEVTQKYHIPTNTRLSSRGRGNELPAEGHRSEVWHKINLALKNLEESRTNGIVLLTGGTGIGKSSVSPPALYLDTISKAAAEKRYEKNQTYGLGELRPGGKILVTQPRKALARTMATYLRGLNPQHEHLFGFQHAGNSTSAQHDEPVLYLTDGIAVAILLSWVAEVIELIRLAREPLSRRGGVLDLSVVNKASKVPWNLQHQVLVVDECHLRSVNCDVIIALTRWLQSVGVPIALLLMSATANEEEFVQKLGVGSEMRVHIRASGFKVDRYIMQSTPTELFQEDTAMPNMVAAIQAIMQILLNDKMWDEEDPIYKTEYWRDPRVGRDILVFLPGTSEISLMATTLECLVKGGYITAVKVYKINARVDQKTLNELQERPNGNDWTSETYASKETWDRIHEDNKVCYELLAKLTKDNSQNFWARRVLLSTEAVNAGITLPQIEWVISTMGVRRVYYDPRREIRVNVLATQTKSSAIQEGGRCGRTFPGKHLMLTSFDEMEHQLQVDELPGVK
eukprot:1632440-Amphidinium_carterae.1